MFEKGDELGEAEIQKGRPGKWKMENGKWKREKGKGKMKNKSCSVVYNNGPTQTCSMAIYFSVRS
jgi:hypothetical protein